MKMARGLFCVVFVLYFEALFASHSTVVMMDPGGAMVNSFPSVRDSIKEKWNIRTTLEHRYGIQGVSRRKLGLRYKGKQSIGLSYSTFGNSSWRSHGFNMNTGLKISSTVSSGLALAYHWLKAEHPTGVTLHSRDYSALLSASCFWSKQFHSHLSVQIYPKEMRWSCAQMNVLFASPSFKWGTVLVFGAKRSVQLSLFGTLTLPKGQELYLCLQNGFEPLLLAYAIRKGRVKISLSTWYHSALGMSYKSGFNYLLP